MSGTTGIYDVIVAGGGPAGAAAAISSARNGARTLLMERYGFLGGMGTAGLVNPFMNFYAGDKQLTRGIFQELVERLKAAGAFGGTGDKFSFDPEELKYLLDEMALESGVELKYHTFVADASAKDGIVKELITESKSGRRAYKAKIYVDCTGDGDVAARSGAEYALGRAEDGYCQPATLMFAMGGVKADRSYVEFYVDEKYGLPQGRVLFFKLPREGEVAVNMTRIVKLDATNADELTRAEIEARKQVKHIIRHLKENVPGFENAYLVHTAAQVGIRESRRIMGEYVLSGEDVLSGRKFDDGVARCSYNIDIHNPTGTGCVIRKLAEGDWYDIPYRCLIPRGFQNLLVAGRCISSTHEAHSSLRIQPTCYALGEAAGAAAALAAKHGLKVGDVDARLLRERLEAQGAL